MLAKDWASIDDFATLFQYLWYRDFPMDDIKAVGVRRVDWTIHIGVVVRKIADFMGLVTRFEEGGRKDAILRSTYGDEIAVEWEWEGVWNANEFKKLKEHKVTPNSKEKLEYAVLITYTHPENIQRVYDRVTEEWQEAKYPLLFILIDLNENRKSKFSMHKEFQNLQMSVFSNGEKVERSELRSGRAFPWEVAGTTWSYRFKK